MKLYSKSALSVLALAVTLTSCLKDKDYDNGATQAVHGNGDQKVISVALSATAAVNFMQLALNLSDVDTTLNLVPIVLAGNAASEDIVVDVVLNPALIGNYNADHGTTKETAPTSVYTILNPAASGGNGYVVTIPKGSHAGYLKVKIKPSDYLGHDYALGVQISKVETAGYQIANNLNAGVAGIGIKNQWDGEYTLDGTLVDHVASGNSSVPGDPYPYNIYLLTTGANTNTMYIPNGGFFHFITGGVVYGEFDPVFTFNGTSITAVGNYYGDPSPSRGRSGELDPTGLNRVNPDKSIDVKYIMKQGGALRTNFDEHMEYVGPRP